MNFDPVMLDRIITSTYNSLENYLENIIHSPSTINRIATHYNIGFDPNHLETVYLMFENQVVQELELPVPPVEIVKKVLLNKRLKQ